MMHSPASRPIAVFGANGRTGTFVAAELRRRGRPVVLVGRDAVRLAAVAAPNPESATRIASTGDAASLDRALAGTAAVINCAGPFLDTATPLIEAALRAGIHYLDVTAEQPAAAAAFEGFDVAARQAGVVVAPAMAFYGGLADALATAALGDRPAADEILVAIALDSWHPTEGTRITGRRNTAPRMIVGDGRMVPLASPAPTGTWRFAYPFGIQETVELPFSEIVTMARHLPARSIRSLINSRPLADLRDPSTPAPAPVDDDGRSAQIFMMEVRVRSGSLERRAAAAGRDIYAISAPIVVEAATRILDGRVRTASGALAAGQLFDAADFLAALPLDRLSTDDAWVESALAYATS